MIGSGVLLVGSIIYNIWVFMGPSTAVTARPPAGADAQALPGASPAGSGPLDPSQVRPLPPVALDRLPQWPRDPFENRRAQAPEIVEVVEGEPPPAAVPDADPVVASILYSSDRRIAMVDGRIVRIGDTIGRSKVVDILPKAVVIQSAEGERKTLELKSGLGAGIKR